MDINKSYEDASSKIYLSEEYQFYKSLKDQNIVSTVKESVQRFSPKIRVNSPTLYYKQIWLESDRYESCSTPKPADTERQFLLPEYFEMKGPKLQNNRYQNWESKMSSRINTVRYQ